MSDPVASFFAYAAEREAIRMCRAAGGDGPYTQDPVLERYRFCNVDREHDRTTIWFADHVREALRTVPDVLLATVLFRWFNRISTGEAIFEQGLIGSGLTAWGSRGQVSMAEWLVLVRTAVAAYCGSGPYVTGSYIIKTPNGMDKLSGVMWCVEQFMSLGYMSPGGRRVHDGGSMARMLIEEPGEHTLEEVWTWLRQFPYMGNFMAYEVVTDLRHTKMLGQAPDIMTWANPGPGARRGLNRIHGRALECAIPRGQLIAEMRALLDVEQKLRQVPTVDWEMRTVEHTLCEFDKYERTRLGQGHPRGVFR